jgi:hypothetical protein
MDMLRSGIAELRTAGQQALSSVMGHLAGRPPTPPVVPSPATPPEVPSGGQAAEASPFPAGEQQARAGTEFPAPPPTVQTFTVNAPALPPAPPAPPPLTPWFPPDMRPTVAQTPAVPPPPPRPASAPVLSPFFPSGTVPTVVQTPVAPAEQRDVPVPAAPSPSTRWPELGQAVPPASARPELPPTVTRGGITGTAFEPPPGFDTPPVPRTPPPVERPDDGLASLLSSLRALGNVPLTPPGLGGQMPGGMGLASSEPATPPRGESFTGFRELAEAMRELTETLREQRGVRHSHGRDEGSAVTADDRSEWWDDWGDVPSPWPRRRDPSEGG